MTPKIPLLILLTPVYQEKLMPQELKRLKLTLTKNKNWVHAFFGPESMDYQNIKSEFPDSQVFKFPNHFFDSISSYNKLMIDPNFYKKFSSYECMLLTQLDSVVVEEIPISVIISFDYIGASWEKPFNIFSVRQRLIITNHWMFRPFTKEILIGNGGLSIRNIKSTFEVLSKFTRKRSYFRLFKLNENLNEDVIISYLMKKYRKRVPTLEESNCLFLEASARFITELNGELGFHALQKFNPKLENKLLSQRM